MERHESAAYWGLFALSAAIGAVAIVTLIPNAAASKPNVLGYRSVCSFAPAATALCGVAAGIVCTIRNRLFSRRASSMRHRPFILPAGLAVVLLAVTLVFGIRFGIAESRFQAVIQSTGAAAPAEAPPGAPAAPGFPDGTRRATFQEDEVSATVEVTVRQGRIDAMQLVSGRNVDEPLARTMFSRVREAGSTEVDAVSGATASSNVLLKAVQAAATGSPGSGAP